MPTNEHQYRLCWSYLLTLAQLHPLVHPLDDDSRCLVLTPQDTLEAHQLMAATFDNEQQPEFEPVQIQGGMPSAASAYSHPQVCGSVCSCPSCVCGWSPPSRACDGMSRGSHRLPCPHLGATPEFPPVHGSFFPSWRGDCRCEWRLPRPQARGIALIAVVDNNVVGIAKLCGSLGMLLELPHNVWRIHQGDHPIDAALGRQTSISQERLYGWTW